MAYTTVQRRLPGPSDFGGELSEMKQQLVEEMSEFTKEGDRVNPTDSQLMLAEQLVRNNDQTRYVKIPFGNIVQQNRDEGCMDMMATAFDVLFRYTVNMLKLKRPRNWHTIKFTNAQFKARADCMIGTRNILKIMGYTKEVMGENNIQNGLAYPDPSQIDHNIIKLIAAELLIAKTEVKVGIDYGNLIVFQNVHLEKPYSAYQEMAHDREPDMYSSMQQQPPSQRFDTVQQPSIQSSYYNPPQSDSHHFNNPSLRQHGSYQSPPQTFSTLQPSTSQQYSYQPRDQTDLQPHFQPTSVVQTDYHYGSHISYQSSYTLKDQSMSVEDLEPTPTDTLNTSGNKLDEIRQRKANIKSIIEQGSPSYSTNYSISPSTSNPVQSSPAVSSQVTQSTAASETTPKPTPKPAPRVKPRTKFFKALPEGDDVTDKKTSIPPQMPQRTATRTMVKCDACDFPNHEKSLECMDCGNPRNERWIKISMSGKPVAKPSPSQDPETLQLFEETPSVAQGNAALPSDSATVTPPSRNQPPPSQVTAVNNNAQYNNQPTATLDYNNQSTAAPEYNNQLTAAPEYNNQSTAAAQYNNPPAAKPRYNTQTSAATGTSTGAAGGQSLKDYVPVVYYTPEEKERMRLEAEELRKKEIMEEQQQQQQQGRRPKEDGGFQNYMPRNDNYGQRNGTMERPTGNVLGYNVAKMTDPGETHHYKSLANEGNLIIQDIKEGLRRGYKLEEIRVATELPHDFRRPCDFLSREWNNYIDRTMFLVNQLSEAEHRKRKMTGSIGQPRRGEIVQYLIEEEGSCERAAQKCCDNRLKMIQELMTEIRLPQSAAVTALENNGLDVNKAIHAVYRDKINSNQLYQYMWGKLEGGGVRQIQNKRVQEMITGKLHNDYYLQRLLMAEYKLPGSGNCNVLIHLVRQFNLSVGACLDVAMMNDKVEAAVQLLTQECPVCTLEYMRDEMINMVHCNHAVCKECFVQHFSLVVEEKSIKHCNCPCCGEPDMSSETIDMDLYLQLFSGLIQVHMSKQQYNLFMQKINERTMMKDPSFRWCIKCTIGFINDAGRDKVECPNSECKQQMCFKCKKPWEAAHEGSTCEQFAEWKKDNDPELQAQGLAAYLNEEGIECPACNFKYALAKGGCMHFKCNQCPAEFCSGCNDFFKKDCTKYQSCRTKGLHAHHPRDCLFYLRDENVEDLQKLLKDNNVEFDTEPPEGQVMAEVRKGIQAVEGEVAEDQPVMPAGGTPVLKCRVMLQKENANGPPIDEECGDPVESGHAGLCKKHYKEYLVFKINQNHIDPLPLYDTGPLRAILMRDEIKVPDQQNGEGEPEYAERLREFIKEKLPLKERAPTNF